jgi:hypothetical protein
MEAPLLVGKALKAIHLTPFRLAHAALLERPNATTALAVCLELSTGELVQISPCEVELPGDQYPAMGLECVKGLPDTTKNCEGESETLETGLFCLPQPITRVDASDPIGEGTPTQFVFSIGQSSSLSVLHVTPMVLAVWASHAS